MRTSSAAADHVGPALTVKDDNSAELAVMRLSAEYSVAFPLRELRINEGVSPRMLARVLQGVAQCPTLRSVSAGAQLPEADLEKCLEALAAPMCAVRSLDFPQFSFFRPLFAALQNRSNWRALRFSAIGWKPEEWSSVCDVVKRNRTALQLDVTAPDRSLEALITELQSAPNLTALKCDPSCDAEPEQRATTWNLPQLASLVTIC